MTRRIAAALALAALAATAAPAHAGPHPVVCVKVTAYALRYVTSTPRICPPYVAVSIPGGR